MELRLFVVIFGDAAWCHPQNITQSFEWESSSAGQISPSCQESRVETRNWKHARINKADQNGQLVNQSTTGHSPHLSLLCITTVDWLIGRLVWSVLLICPCFQFRVSTLGSWHDAAISPAEYIVSRNMRKFLSTSKVKTKFCCFKTWDYAGISRVQCIQGRISTLKSPACDLARTRSNLETLWTLMESKKSRGIRDPAGAKRTKSPWSSRIRWRKRGKCPRAVGWCDCNGHGKTAPPTAAIFPTQIPADPTENKHATAIKKFNSISINWLKIEKEKLTNGINPWEKSI